MVLLLFLNYVLLALNQIASSINQLHIIPSFLAESCYSLYWLQSAESSIFMHDCSKDGVFINSFYNSGHLCPHYLMHKLVYNWNVRLPSNQHSEKKKSLLLSRKKPFLSLVSRLNGKRSFIVCPVFGCTPPKSIQLLLN